MRTAVAGFDWDKGNREKCRKHGVPIGQIEELFAGHHSIGVDVEHSLTEQRFKMIGRTRAGRFIFLVFTLRQRDGGLYIRPIRARYMHRKEIERYEQENPDLRQ